MKKYISIIGLSLIVLLTSCDNYLDLVPKGESVLNTTDDYLGLVESMDAAYPTDDFWYFAGDATWPYKDQIENYQYPLRSISFLWDETEGLRQQNMVSSELYSKCYSRIANYNIVVENMNDAEGPEADKRLGIAQAKAMRAYNYFMLVNTFAKPYVKETAATDNGIIIHKKFDLEAVSKQYTVQEVYDFIMEDLNSAIVDLPETPLNEFRPSKTLGWALKAKVHLYKGELDSALNAGLEALKSTYHKLWDMRPMFYNGLEELPFGDMQSTGWSSVAIHLKSDPENLLYQFCNNDQGEPSPLFIRKETLDLFDKQNDLRYKTCVNYDTPNRPTGESGARMFGSNQVKWNCGGIRFSEVYLIVAECYARLNDPENAMKYLNELYVNRVKNNTPELTAANADEAFEQVRKERKRELMFTYNGFFDMRRFSVQLNETFTRTYVNTAGETQEFILEPGSPLYVWPFPQNAMETSNLVQNTK